MRTGQGEGENGQGKDKVTNCHLREGEGDNWEGEGDNWEGKVIMRKSVWPNSHLREGEGDNWQGEGDNWEGEGDNAKIRPAQFSP